MTTEARSGTRWLVEQGSRVRPETGNAIRPLQPPISALQALFPDAARNDLMGRPKKHPDSFGAGVADQCQVIKRLDESGGDAPYMTWWHGMGLAKHLKDGDEWAARWTRARAATGHDKHDPAAGMESWQAGPPLCETIAMGGGDCSGCPHRGKGMSPISFGVPDTLAAVEQSAAGKAVPGWVAELNTRFSVLRWGADVVVVDEQTPSAAVAGVQLGRGFLSLAAFRALHAGRFVPNPSGDKPQPMAAAWLNHPGRRQFDGAVFSPPPCAAAPSNVLNLWRGFAVEPEEWLA